MSDNVSQSGFVADQPTPAFKCNIGFMRVPLIIGAGTGWSATSPLHLTLQRSNKCAHVGLQKESHLLYHVYSDEAWKWRKPWYDFIMGNSENPHYKNEWHLKDKYAFTENLDEIEELFTKPTLETYIKYYKRHYERIKHEYKYVADFSNSNAMLPLHFLQKIAPELRKHFKIKVLIIFRDPVRRLYSELSSQYQCNKELQEKYPTSKDYWRSYLKKGNYSINCDYVKRIKYYKSVFSTTTIVSEDLWSGDLLTLRKLSNFLQYDIKNLYPNCYYPEMGTKAPVIENLADQYKSDLEDLTDDDLNFGRKYLAKTYEDWYDMFGTTPWRC